ncbi:MAG: MiaB/RimO family radical SAM methylthiotransferase [Anaerolineaceae bacterium]|nr:MiaB/RimO family radical SAM methylthiotransferase [Anaerolineaceae bacterium]
MKFYLDSIGCRLNQSEIEKIAAGLRDAGHIVVGDASDADVSIVNTCAVTNAASADSRKVIRRIANSGCKEIFATGCYATIDPLAVAGLPAVVGLYKNDRKDFIVSDLANKYISVPIHTNIRKPLPGKKRRTRAFIKVQDGCDNQCTFCVTRIARGKSHSQTEDEIFYDIEAALLGGVKEIVLTGVNLGSWGNDLGIKFSLPKLINKIIQKYAPDRLRLSSLEPWDINKSYFSIFNHPVFCQHLHLPLQAGSDVILRRMGRKMLTGEFCALVNEIRSYVPEIAITTDIMVGFPGETKKEFEEGLFFIKKMNFSGGHVFRYSARPGTAAEKFDHLVPEIEKKIRSEQMRRVILISEIKYKKKFIDRGVSVLWEKAKKLGNANFLLSGLTGNYLRVNAIANENLQNKISNVKIKEVKGTYLFGNIIS